MIRSLGWLVALGLCTLRGALSQDYDPARLLALLQEVPLAAAEAEGTRLVVFDGLGAPREGAEVLLTPTKGWRALPSGERKRALDEAGRDPNDRLVTMVRVLGQRYRTGEDGSVIVPSGTDWVVRVVVRGGMRAAALPRDTREFELVVDHVETVTVRARDGDGKLVPGVEVGLYHGRATRRATTDSQGVASFVVPASWTAPGAMAVGPQQWNLGREVEEQIRVPVVEFVPDGPPLEVELPPSGRVRFILYDDRERPVARLRGASLKETNGWYSGYRSELEGDSVMFERVPLGIEFTASIAVEGIVGRLQYRAKGPQRPGELVVVDGRLKAGPPALALVVRGMDGELVAGEGMGFAVVAGREHERYFAATDANGRVQLALSDEFTDDMWADAKLYVDRRGSGGSYQGMAVVALPKLVRGVVEVDEIQLVEPPILASGVIVDAEGEPVAGMTVRAASAVTRGRHSSGPIGRMSMLRMHLSAHMARTDATGRFALRELEPIHGPVTLRVTGREGYAVEGHVEAALGEEEIRILAHRTGGLRATLRGGPFSGAEMTLTARRRQAGRNSSHAVRATDGVLHFEDLPAGTYDLELRSTHMDDPLEIEGVEVPAGGRAQDPRLEGIDWSSGFRFITVRVIGPDGAPFVANDLSGQGAVHCHVYSERGNRTGTRRGTDEAGTTTFFAPFKRAEIAVKFEGYFHEVVPADRDQITITLRHAPAVVATLAESAVLPKGLNVDFQLDHPRDGPWSGGAVRPLKPGVYRKLQATLPGAQRLVMVLSSFHRYGDDGEIDRARARAWERYKVLYSVDLDIGEGSETIALQVELDEAAQERVLDAARALGLGDQ